ncbi:Uncharacterized protein Fot_19931 [Forsythia ovata]|uniref:Uncharacterized protein n=1 Tax=Forsythia ovata TaxID=205694 RepID=A0ABD1VMG4_9LAMI
MHHHSHGAVTVAVASPPPPPPPPPLQQTQTLPVSPPPPQVSQPLLLALTHTAHRHPHGEPTQRTNTGEPTHFPLLIFQIYQCPATNCLSSISAGVSSFSATQTTHRHPHGEPSEPTAYLPYLPVSPPFLQHKQPTDILTVNPANQRRRTHRFSFAYLPTPANPPPSSQ